VEKPTSQSGNNLLLAVVSLVAVSAVTAGFTAYICTYVLNSFQDSHTMALFITDTGIKSDDKNLEHQLSTATLALKFMRDIGWALGVGSLMVGVAVFFRQRKGIR
jgi:hypothetical protein